MKRLTLVLTLLLTIGLFSCDHMFHDYLEHEATIKKGEQGDGSQIGNVLQGKGFWKGDIIRLRVAYLESAWFPVESKFYGDVTPIFKSGGFGEAGFFGNHRKAGASVGWTPAKEKGYFWVGTYVHNGNNPPVFHYAMKVKAGVQFDVSIRKSSEDKKYYYRFRDETGKDIFITEENSGKEFICYKLYFYLGGEGVSKVVAPHNLNCLIIYMEDN